MSDMRKRALARLAAFHKREGHVQVPFGHSEGGFALGRWVSRMRSRKEHLAVELVRQLEAVPGWTWRSMGPGFQHRLRALTAFVLRESTARVPRSHREHGIRLGSWVLEQQRRHALGRLTADQTAALETVPGWSWEPTPGHGPMAWERAYAVLVNYVRREGHSLVPFEHREKGFKLGRWVNAQRGRHHRGRLHESRALRLESLARWTWRAGLPLTDQKRARALLEKFVAREGHARVSATHVEEGFKLGNWVNRLREAKRTGRLTRAEERALERLPDWSWSPYGERFATGVQMMRAFARREGHASPAFSHVEAGFPLGRWVASVRNNHRAGRLGRGRAPQLQAIRGWTWSPGEERFQELLQALKRFVAREGHSSPPASHREDGLPLGNWAASMRRQHDSHRLEASRVRALEAVDGWSWVVSNPNFERGVAMLRRYAAREGHAMPGSFHVEEGFRLGWWAVRRRGEYRKGLLSTEQVATLESVPGWSWAPRGRARRRID